MHNRSHAQQATYLKQRPASAMILITSITLLLFAGAMSAGCGSNAKKDIEVRGEIRATEALNPDVNGDSRPVQIKVFYLKATDAFSKASFLELYQTPGDVLMENMLKSNTYQIQPGQSISIEDRAPDDTIAVGVIAAFRDIDNAEWRAVVSTPEKCYLSCPNSLRKDALLIDLTRLTVRVRLGD